MFKNKMTNISWKCVFYFLKQKIFFFIKNYMEDFKNFLNIYEY